MLGAGAAWGIYSLRGRGARDPLAITADNFARSVPLTLALSALMLRSEHASPAGLGLAMASGALASGVGYSFWYAALRSLTATRAAVIQLSVPIIAAAGAVALLGEQLTLRLLASGAAILVGVWLAIGRR
ncbi:MAG TPA: DMT family transporter, partial [Myxococcaceae bacterium]|nr:DMT family transporter [Myxococcaceae bacterium]